MSMSNTSGTAVRRPGYNGLKTCLLLVASLALPIGACGGANNDSEGRRLPTDAQVIEDVTPADTENVVDVHVVKGRSGESYLHSTDRVWYFDRGVVIKRKAHLPDAPDAVVVVGGLARYQLMGDHYEYARFLTTYNEYEGISAPSESDLTGYVEQNLKQVFVSRDHDIFGVDSIELQADTSWTWHTPNSFSVPFLIRYEHRTNRTTLEEREDLIDIRFYRNAIDDPVHALMATEQSRTVIGKKTLSADAINQMKTLRTDFK